MSLGQDAVRGFVADGNRDCGPNGAVRTLQYPYKIGEAIIMRKLPLFFFLFACLLAMPAGAQSHLDSTPSGAGSGPAYDAAVGYTYLTTSIPGAGRVNLNGLDGSGRIDFNSRWGATADSTYVRTSNVLDGNGGYILTLLGGPVFYPLERGNIRTFVDALGGAGLVDSAVPTTGPDYLRGWVARYAYAAGGGVEYSFSGRFAVRFGADYLRTAFVDSSDVVQMQNNLRLTTSFVVRLKERQPQLVLH